MLFFEIFDNLSLDLKLKKLFERVKVLSYKRLNDSGCVDIYLESDSFIPRKCTNRVEEAILRSYTDSSIERVKLKIAYSFAKGRSFEDLWREYHSYLDSEIYAISPVFGDTYRNSNVSAENGIITLSLYDTPIIRNRIQTLCGLIEEMWEEMFGSRIACIYKLKKEEVQEDSQTYLSRYSASLERYKASEGRSETVSVVATEEVEQDDGSVKTGQENASVEIKKQSTPKASSNTTAGREQTKQANTEKPKNDTPYRNNNSGYKRKPMPKEDPDVIYGRNVEGDLVNISDLYEGIGICVIRGMVLLDGEERELSNGKVILTFDITDFTYSIRCKAFIDKEEYSQIKDNFKQGKFLRVKGVPEYDSYAKDILFQHLDGIKPDSDFRKKRMDDAEVKRIELHCHSKMSDMDGVASVEDLIKTAMSWGHRGIALTDHGVVQGFTDALHTLDKIISKSEGEKKKKAEEFKMIYGCEGYIVDDEPDSVTDSKGKVFHKQEDGTYSREDLLKMPVYHIILLCKNDIGRINLYRLVSESHLNYFSRRPRIPKSLLAKYREGIIVGSACEAGELFRAVIHNKPDEEIERIARFYDYYEIQQIGNNRYMIEDDHFPEVNSDEDLKRANKRISELADADGKLCIATCDVHFINPEDEVFRRILMYSKGFEDADNQAPLYLHTTEEMIDECRYLGDKKAYEVVVTNPNLIFDMCDRIVPVRPDKCPPVIEDSDKTLREICERKVTETYGENLHPIIRERLDRELNSIIKNGFAVMYIIAQKLVWKSNEDGYLVGSRGSVGSSFVATMAGITEVNPLPGHYYCKKCHYIDFDSETVREYGQFSGFDMPDMNCPVCGEPLIKQGQNIPFETFLGFNGDKEPDIDLNFSGEYQSKAHDYTEVIFGAGQTFKAGTVGTVADKTAVAYAKKYCAEHSQAVNDAELFRMASGCIDVKKTTGQHPGGIVVLPIGEDINTFTPVQHPANKDVPIVTTHFDYHSIDHNLLKLDILGHDDPTMIRMLE
ncbi:MAG: PHP domain-containing protein, partial [Lachnospiraceae bacterium]|nr:PHP domain-containing protein [Lachnospiraceae bacterium]